MSNRKVRLSYSNDGGRNYQGTRERSLGEVGEYEKRVRFDRMGAFRTRVFKFSVSSPVKRDCLGAVAKMDDSRG